MIDVSSTQHVRQVSVTLGVETTEEVEHLTCLGSVVDTRDWTEAGVRTRIGKARVAIFQLKNIRECKALSLKKEKTR